MYYDKCLKVPSAKRFMQGFLSSKPIAAGEEEALQYELCVARGWQRTRRQAGSVLVARKPDAFATVAISMCATTVGTVATPTLVVLPAQQPPVRAEPVLLQVAEQ